MSKGREVLRISPFGPTIFRILLGSAQKQTRPLFTLNRGRAQAAIAVLLVPVAAAAEAEAQQA